MRPSPDPGRAACLLALSLGLLACRPGPPVQAAFDPGETGDPSGREDAAPTSDAPEDPAARERRDRMDEHFAAISAIRDALVTGDLDRARALAGELHDQPRPADDDRGWAPHTRAVADAAGKVSGASDLETGALATAALAQECGRCHTSLGVTIDLPVPDAPRTAKTVESSMEVHRWAAQRMWEGIVFPSQERWIRGTSMFVALPGCGEVHPDSKTPVSDSPPKCQDVQRVVRQSHDPEDAQQRAESYGKLLVTCAACHTSGQ